MKKSEKKGKIERRVKEMKLTEEWREMRREGGIE